MNKIKCLVVKIILKLGNFRWIITDENDIGFRVFGVVISYYKWSDTAIVWTDIGYRVVDKRELTDICSFEK